MCNARIAVLVPCYNEEVTIGQVVSDFEKGCRAPLSMSMIIIRRIARSR